MHVMYYLHQNRRDARVNMTQSNAKLVMFQEVDALRAESIRDDIYGIKESDIYTRSREVIMSSMLAQYQQLTEK